MIDGMYSVKETMKNRCKLLYSKGGDQGDMMMIPT